jgi:GntR family transcriptional regulator, rspAB operon transcriptional repressor
MSKTPDGASAQRFGHHVPAVYDGLRAMILNGTIPAGKTTTQQELAELVDAGRAPVREALRMLQNEGLVVLVANRRVRITDLSIDELEGLQAMRIVLECVALRHTIPSLTREDLAEIGGLLAQMEDYVRDGDFTRHEVPHRAFHLRLVSGATDAESRQLERLYDHATRYRRIAANVEPDYQARLAEHRAIAEAARSRDVTSCARLLAVHYLRTVEEVGPELEPGYQMERLLAAAEVVAPGVGSDYAGSHARPSSAEAPSEQVD